MTLPDIYRIIFYIIICRGTYSNGTTKTIQSLERAFSILELFQNNKTEMSLKGNLGSSLGLNQEHDFLGLSTRLQP